MKKVVVIAALAALAAWSPALVRAEEKAHDHATEHKHGEGHEAEGDMHADLGSTETAGMKLKVIQLSKVVEGKEAVFELETAGDPQPKAIRAWIGTRSAEGSMKGKAEKEDAGAWHLHVDVPKTLREGCQLWLEVEADSGQRTKIAFDTKSE